MLKKIKLIFKKICDHFSYEECHSSMERTGEASMGCCHGLAGGDKHSGYLCYDCIDCKYLVLCDEKGEK